MSDDVKKEPVIFGFGSMGVPVGIEDIMAAQLRKRQEVEQASGKLWLWVAMSMVMGLAFHILSFAINIRWSVSLTDFMKYGVDVIMSALSGGEIEAPEQIALMLEGVGIGNLITSLMVVVSVWACLVLAVANYKATRALLRAKRAYHDLSFVPTDEVKKVMLSLPEDAQQYVNDVYRTGRAITVYEWSLCLGRRDVAEGK